MDSLQLDRIRMHVQSLPGMASLIAALLDENERLRADAELGRLARIYERARARRIQLGMQSPACLVTDYRVASEAEQAASEKYTSALAAFMGANEDGDK